MNYLDYQIKPLPDYRKRREPTATHSRSGKPHYDDAGDISSHRPPPGIVRQKVFAKRYGVSPVAVRRACASGELDIVLDEQGNKWIRKTTKNRTWGRRQSQKKGVIDAEFS